MCAMLVIPDQTGWRVWRVGRILTKHQQARLLVIHVLIIQHHPKHPRLKQTVFVMLVMVEMTVVPALNVWLGHLKTQPQTRALIARLIQTQTQGATNSSIAPVTRDTRVPMARNVLNVVSIITRTRQAQRGARNARTSPRPQLPVMM